jgi:hypothetical protein
MRITHVPRHGYERSRDKLYYAWRGCGFMWKIAFKIVISYFEQITSRPGNDRDHAHDYRL